MARFLRRALLLAASATALLLAACGGSSTVESELKPSRIIVFGDAFADLGQAGSRYTINTGGTNIWTLQLATRYGLTLNPAAAGGTSYATGNARVVARPDAAGNASTPTVKEQIDTFLAGGRFADTDLVILNAGIADVVAETARFNAGAQTSAQLTAAAQQAGRDLAAQVRRLVQAGANHVVVVGPYNLGRSPWAIQTGQVGLLTDVSGKFNEELLVSIVDLGDKVLYVDLALYYNLVTSSPSSYNLSNATALACTSVDPGPGIGTGANQVNSALCSSSTLAAGIDPAQYLFADRLYPTPMGHRLFGDWAYDRITNRW